MPGYIKSKSLTAGGKTMAYLEFGRGEKTLLILPGIGDGLRTVRGLSTPLTTLYRTYAKHCRVVVLSRPNELISGTTTRAMAEDVRRALDVLHIDKVWLMGVSQGGMVAQYLALDHPERVEKLILVSTLARPNAALRTVVTHWMAMQRHGDERGILLDIAERSYSPAYLKHRRAVYHLTGLFTRPQDSARFVALAESCLTHDTYARLPELTCPTFIVAGSEDHIVGPICARELAHQIPGSQCAIYLGLGHGVYDEAPDFHARTLAFLEKQ